MHRTAMAVAAALAWAGLAAGGRAQTNTPAAPAEPAAVRVLRQLAQSPDDRELVGMLGVALRQEAGDAERGRLAVIYCLGCYHVGRDADAEAAKAAAVRAGSALEFLQYLAPKYTREPCPACQGRGQVTSPCNACRGGKRCDLCAGNGFRMMEGLNGVRRKAACPRCRGSGQCTICSGAGMVAAPCASCRGTGQRTAREKVKRVYLALLKGENPDAAAFADVAPPPAVTPPTRPDGGATAADHTPSRPAVAPGEAEKEMAQYTAGMESLDRLYRQGQFDSASITEVKQLTDRYVGKLLQMRANIVSCYPREVVVAARSTAAEAEGLRLIPRDRDIGMKAVDVFKAAGKEGRVLITFGVVNRQNLTLFDLKYP